jgi:hypothetical protein
MSIERKIRWVLLAVSLTSPASLQAAQVTVDAVRWCITTSKKKPMKLERLRVASGGPDLASKFLIHLTDCFITRN